MGLIISRKRFYELCKIVIPFFLASFICLFWWSPNALPTRVALSVLIFLGFYLWVNWVDRIVSGGKRGLLIYPAFLWIDDINVKRRTRANWDKKSPSDSGQWVQGKSHQFYVPDFSPTEATMMKYFENGRDSKWEVNIYSLVSYAEDLFVGESEDGIRKRNKRPKKNWLFISKLNFGAKVSLLITTVIPFIACNLLLYVIPTHISLLLLAYFFAFQLLLSIPQLFLRAFLNRYLELWERNMIVLSIVIVTGLYLFNIGFFSGEDAFKIPYIPYHEASYQR